MSNGLNARQAPGESAGYEKPADRRPYRALSAIGPVLTVKTDTLRLDLRQVGWIGQSGAFYSLDETHMEYEPGSISPLYFPAHTDRLDEVAQDSPVDAQLSRLSEVSRRALESLENLIAEDREPAVETLGARYELARALGDLSLYELPLDEVGFNPVADTLREELTASQEKVAELLHMIAKTTIEANDVGGVDLNDLVTDVLAAGFVLPDDNEDGDVS